jgi:tetraacyldisaccharide 4'-kinase
MSAIADAVEAAWAADSVGRRVVVGLLEPVAAAYAAGVAIRNALYDRGLVPVTRVPATVVSVGNLTVGGSGKTPTVLWLAAALARRGRRVGVVTRGYGRRRRGVVVVGTDGRALVDPGDGGDEATLVATRLAVPVIAAERRAEGAALACERFGCDTLVLDDGFQHRALARDADLVLVPAEGLPGRLFPAGPLREPPRALARARAVLALGDESRVSRPPAAPRGNTPTFVGRVVPTATVVAAEDGVAVHDLAVLPRRSVVAVAGVARPERFWALLGRLGVEVVERLRFADHHPYTAADLDRIRRAAAVRGRAVVTTEKDLVKLARLEGGDALGLYALRIEVEVEDGERLVDLLLAPPEVALRPD